MLMFRFQSRGIQNTNILFAQIDFRLALVGGSWGRTEVAVIHNEILRHFCPASVAAEQCVPPPEIYIRAQRPLCPLLVRHVPPGTDLCPAQSMPSHRPSRRAAAPHQPRRPAARASHRAGNKSVPRQSVASAKRISRVPIKF